MNSILSSVPGTSTPYSIQYRHVFTDTATRVAASPNAVIDSTKTRDTGNTDVTQLRAGTLMGKVTSGGLMRNSIIGVLGTTIGAGAATTITVPAAVATEVSRLIALAGASIQLRVYGPPSAGGTNAATTVTASAAAGTAITVSVVTFPAYVAASILQPVDGAETPLTVIPDGYGIPLTDVTGTSQNQLLHPYFIQGTIDVAQIPFYSSLDASLKTWVKTALRTTANTNFTFSDDR